MSQSPHSSIQSFMDYLKFEKRYSAHTIISYQNDLTDFFAYVEEQFGKIELTEINAAYIRSWLAGMKEKDMKARTIIRKISSLRSYFKFQLKTGSLEISPMVNIITPKTGKRLPVFVKESETRQLLQSLAGSTEDWKSLNAKMLLTLFYSTGMRLSELIGLKEKQIDFSRGHIKVLGKGNKERIIPVSAEMLVNIKEYQKHKKKQFEAPDECGD